MRSVGAVHRSIAERWRAGLGRTAGLTVSAINGRRSSARLDAHELIAKIPHTRPWQITDYGHNVIGTTMYLREHHFQNVDDGVMQ